MRLALVEKAAATSANLQLNDARRLVAIGSTSRDNSRVRAQFFLGSRQIAIVLQIIFRCSVGRRQLRDEGGSCARSRRRRRHHRRSRVRHFNVATQDRSVSTGGAPTLRGARRPMSSVRPTAATAAAARAGKRLTSS